MYSCGLRLGEAVKIEVSHIEKSTGNLTIIGKRNRQRLVPIPPTTLQALRQTWSTHKHKQYLFPNRYAKTYVSDSRVRVAFKQACLSTGIKDATIHVLRHSFATRLLENDADTRIVDIMRQFGPLYLHRFSGSMLTSHKSNITVKHILWSSLKS